MYWKLTNAFYVFLYISIYYKYINSLCKQKASLHDNWNFKGFDWLKLLQQMDPIVKTVQKE